MGRQNVPAEELISEATKEKVAQVRRRLLRLENELPKVIVGSEEHFKNFIKEYRYQYEILASFSADDLTGVDKVRNVRESEGRVLFVYFNTQTARWEINKILDPKCFIATAAYGSPVAPEIATLRRFRDDVLLTSKWGRRFVTFYYSVSPSLASVILRYRWLRRVVRQCLLEPVLYLIKKGGKLR